MPVDPLSLLIQGGGALGGFLGNMFGGSDAPSYDQLLEQGQMHEGNAYDQIALDPQALSAALASLAQMREMAAQGGMDTQSRVANQEALDAVNRNEQMQRGAVLQNMEQTGMNGAGYAAQLQGTQTGANAAAKFGSGAAADSRTRALQAAAASGNLGMGIRGQQYDEASRRAQSQNAINMFNASQRAQAGNQAGYNAAQNTDRWSRVGAGAGQAAGAAAGYAYNPYGSEKLADDDKWNPNKRPREY